MRGGAIEHIWYGQLLRHASLGRVICHDEVFEAPSVLSGCFNLQKITDVIKG